MGQLTESIKERAMSGEQITLDEMLGIIETLETIIAIQEMKEDLFYENIKEMKEKEAIDEIKIQKLRDTIESMVKVGF